MAADGVLEYMELTGASYRNTYYALKGSMLLMLYPLQSYGTFF